MVYGMNRHELTLLGTALFCFFFNDTPPTEIYTLSLHDALPISHLIAAADAHQVDHATIKSNGTEITWDYQGNHYKTIFRDTFQIEQILRDDKINFNTEAPSSSNLLLSVILPNVILFLVIGGFMWYMLR